MAAMSDNTAVANLALSYLGQRSVNDITATNLTGNAAVVGQYLDDARQFVLCENRWLFAQKRNSLPVLSSTPAFHWTKEYLLPTECLQLLQVGTDDYPLVVNRDYQVKQRKIETNEDAPLPVIYTVDETDVAQMHPYFRFSWAAFLAHMAAPEVLQSSDKSDDLLNLYQKFIEKASLANAIENKPRQIDNSRWRNSMQTLQPGRQVY